MYGVDIWQYLSKQIHSMYNQLFPPFPDLFLTSVLSFLKYLAILFLLVHHEDWARWSTENSVITYGFPCRLLLEALELINARNGRVWPRAQLSCWMHFQREFVQFPQGIPSTPLLGVPIIVQCCCLNIASFHTTIQWGTMIGNLCLAQCPLARKSWSWCWHLIPDSTPAWPGGLGTS
jgi:hypothetical protein